MLAGLRGFNDLVGDIKLDGCVLFQMNKQEPLVSFG